MTVAASQRSATALGFATGCAGLPFVYAVVRFVLARVDPDADPVAVVWSEHSPSLTRLMITLYATAALTGGAIAICKARPAASATILTAIASLSAAAVLVLGVVAP